MKPHISYLHSAEEEAEVWGQVTASARGRCSEPGAHGPQAVCISIKLVFFVILYTLKHVSFTRKRYSENGGAWHRKF